MVLQTALVRLRDGTARNLRDANAPGSREAWSTRNDGQYDGIALAHSCIYVHCASDTNKWEKGRLLETEEQSDVRCMCAPLILTVLTRCAATDRWGRTAARHEELVRVADVVHDLGPVQREMVKVESNLANVRMHLQDSELTAARPVRTVRMVRVDEVSSIFTHHSATRCHNCTPIGKPNVTVPACRFTLFVQLTDTARPVPTGTRSRWYAAAQYALVVGLAGSILTGSGRTQPLTPLIDGKYWQNW